MQKEDYARLTFILSLIAAVLALAGALISYVKRGDVNIALIAAGVFLLAFGFGAKGRISASK
jgi:formate hydrogenlyase subunit 3/multisubunit Na+/H+ antiporter MnhD subunit